MSRLALAGLCLLLAAPAAAQAPDVILASPTEIEAALAAMEKEMKPGQNFMWRPLLRAGENVAALEIWRAPGRPAAHPTEAEYARVVAGSGSLVFGGILVDQVTTPSGMLEGSRIEGATTRPLKPGDTILIPAGMPHGFGVEGGRLVLLGIKVPVAK